MGGAAILDVLVPQCICGAYIWAVPRRPIPGIVILSAELQNIRILVATVGARSHSPTGFAASTLGGVTAVGAISICTGCVGDCLAPINVPGVGRARRGPLVAGTAVGVSLVMRRSTTTPGIWRGAPGSGAPWSIM